MTGEAQSGGCLCGKVRYTLKTRAENAAACHCNMCRKWSGGVYLAFHTPAAAAELTGEEHVQWYKSSPWGSRGFCGVCGSGLFFRIDPMAGAPDEEMIIMLGTLDDPGPVRVTSQIFIDEKPAGYSLAGETENLTGAEFKAKYMRPDG